MNTKTISGEVVENPYGNWSDVDRGWYIGSDKVQTLLYEYEGKNVKITIEVLPENDSPKNAIELIEEVDEDVSIDWWKQNRKDLNKVIRFYNEWQSVTNFDVHYGKFVLSHANNLKESSEEKEYSNWQIEILNTIIERIENLERN